MVNNLNQPLIGFGWFFLSKFMPNSLWIEQNEIVRVSLKLHLIIIL